MKKLWFWLVDSGITADMDSQLSKKIKLTNEISTCISLIASCYIFIFSFLGFKKDGLEVIFVALSVFAPVLLNRYKLYLLSRLWLLIAINTVVFIYSLKFGEAAGIQIVHFEAAFISWIVFELRDSKYISFGFGLSVISIFLYYYISGGKPVLPVTPDAQKTIMLFVTASMFVMLGLFLRFWQIQNFRSEKFLSDTYKQFFEDVPAPMWIFDADTYKFLAVNEKAIEKYQYEKDEFLNLALQDIRRAEINSTTLEVLTNTKEASEIDAGYFLHRKKNGETFYVHMLSNRTIYNEKIARVVLAIDVHDKILTDRKNDELKYSLMKAEIRNKYKSQFLANISHELRTPLNSIMILTKLLQEGDRGDLNELQREFVDIIHRSGADLLNLINDILDLSKIEAGKIDFVFEDVSVDSLVHNMTQTFSIVADEKNISFETKIEKGVPEHIYTDRLRIEQVVKNLLSNAFKFTNKNGQVRLNIGLQNGRMAISVADNGIGILPEKQQLIFEAFEQADGSASREFGGTGLGLSISQEIVNRLQGKIELESAVGKGSIFTVLLPVRS